MMADLIVENGLAYGPEERLTVCRQRTAGLE
jgi:hypothetical protein